MRVIFAGTPDFAVPALQALLDSEHDVIAVYTQPDRPAGRGRKLTASPVKQLAQQNQLPIHQPKTLKSHDVQRQIKQLNPESMIVAAYGLILPQSILDIPVYGCINIHASLLPRWRGAAPIQHAILAGDAQTGITIMQMDEGLDTGAILKQAHCAIAPDETSKSLHNKLAGLGAVTLIETLNNLKNIKPIAQNHSQATYAAKIHKQQAKIDWQQSAIDIERKVRAFNPWPVAFCEFETKPLRIWRATAVNTQTDAAPGTIVDFDKKGIRVATKNGLLNLLSLQLPGSNVISAADFINTHPELSQKQLN